MTPKQTKARAILKAMNAICGFYGADIHKVLDASKNRGTTTHWARETIVCYLHKNGIKHSEIAGMFGMAIGWSKRLRQQGSIRLLVDEKKMIETLPKL